MRAALRRQLFSAGFAAIAATGANRWLRRAAQGRGVILTFHHVRPWVAHDGFAPNGLLEITPEYLDEVIGELRRSGFDIVSIEDVPARLAEDDPGAPFAVLTFDDGYRDVVEHGVPVLRRHGVPWTFYISTDFADGRGCLWWIELEEAIRHLKRVTVPLGAETVSLPAGSALEKAAAFDRLYWLLRAGPEERLRDAVASLAAAAGVDSARLVERLCLGWTDLKALVHAEADLTVGAHTLSHPMLAKHEIDAARREIVESRARIETELGVTVRHFAYPVGDPGSAGPREFRLARDAGFATAVTTRPGHLFAAHGDHPTALPRVSVNGNFQSRAALRALLSGVPFLAWNRGRRLDVT
jgi:peptidoglycan/xylan/chitin deacetylase (PgdA/CDA1 family)